MSHAGVKGHFDGRPLAFFGALLALMLAASNLRGGLVVIGPLVEDIRFSLDISAAAFGFLMTLPLLCFAGVSIAVPWLANKISPLRVVLGALLVISMGAGLRLADSYPMMVLGTFLLGTGVAILNVLIPGLVKGLFPRQSGTLTGLYSLVLTLGATLSVYFAIPLRDQFQSWQAPLAVWAALPLLVVLLWLPMLRIRFEPHSQPGVSKAVWRIPRAWALALFMGLQSLVFYVLATWMPRIFMDAGYSDSEAGTLSSMLTLLSIPFSLIVPIVAARMRSQRPINLMIAVFGLAGLAGLQFSPDAYAQLWMVFLGIHGGSSLSLCLVLFALKSNDMRQATALSALTQGAGYLLASVGPSMIGAIYDLQSNWHLPLYLLMAMVVGQFFTGWSVCRAGKIDEPAP